jgi:signal transduction histidine kinase
MRRLYTRIYLHFLGVLLVVGFALSLVFATGWRTAFIRPFTLRLVNHLAMTLSQLPDVAARRRLVQRLSSDLDLDLTLRRLDGTVESSTGEELPSLAAREFGEVQKGPTVIHRGRRWMVVAPIRDRSTGDVIGVLESFPMRRFAPNTLVRPVGMVLLVLIVVGLATLPLARRISSPVEALTEASRRLGAGELGYRIPIPVRQGRPFGHPRHSHRPEEMEALLGAWNDMADRVERLVRGQRELLANVSHELRSPMARMQVALALLPDDEATEARARDLRQDLAELDRLIEDVLTSSRLDATGLPVHVERVEIEALLSQLVERAGHDPATAACEVRLGAVDALELEADGALLRRALWNLVENAAKYGVPPITLSAERVGERLLLRVADEGRGISAADRERVFEPFFRGDRARTPAAAGRGGFGLGLTFARRVAEVHGGSIRLESLDETATHGCLITLDLPMQRRVVL